MELTLENLTKHYGDKYALHGANLKLTPGVWGLLGPNGAGKTTMMNMIVDILAPTDGAVIWCGKNIRELGAAYRRSLGFLPQNLGIYKHFSARDYLRYMATLKGVHPKDKKKREQTISDLLEKVNLTADAHRRAGAFSGGMRQRLGIAQALLGDPKLLVIDEPTAGLDPQERVRFRTIIGAESAEQIVLWSTHIVSDIESIAKQVIFIRQGQILAVEEPADIEQRYLHHFGEVEV